jgi:hypothetical protein
VPEARLPRLLTLAPLLLGATLACADATSPDGSVLAGTWGGPDATLTLSALGGTVEYACGASTVDAGWGVGAGRMWHATGQYYSGGGPAPSEGRPPHAATYLGRLQGDVLTFTVTVPDLGAVLGPFTVTRNAPGASEICV